MQNNKIPNKNASIIENNFISKIKKVTRNMENSELNNILAKPQQKSPFINLVNERETKPNFPHFPDKDDKLNDSFGKIIMETKKTF